MHTLWEGRVEHIRAAGQGRVGSAELLQRMILQSPTSQHWAQSAADKTLPDKDLMGKARVETGMERRRCHLAGK